MELTIKEIQDKKTDAERQIVEILENLTMETGLNINDVTFRHEQYSSIANDRFVQVITNFKIEMSI